MATYGSGFESSHKCRGRLSRASFSPFHHCSELHDTPDNLPVSDNGFLRPRTRRIAAGLHARLCLSAHQKNNPRIAALAARVADQCDAEAERDKLLQGFSIDDVVRDFGASLGLA